MGGPGGSWLRGIGVPGGVFGQQQQEWATVCSAVPSQSCAPTPGSQSHPKFALRSPFPFATGQGRGRSTRSVGGVGQGVTVLSPQQEGPGPEGGRGARLVWVCGGHYLLVSGFDR